MRRVLAAALAPLRLDAGFAAAPEARAGATAAAVALGVSLGLQLTVWAVLAFGPLAEPFSAADLTDMGRKNMRPEHDLPAFYAGCFATVVLAWAVVRLFEARLAGRVGEAAERAARRGAIAHAALAALSLALFAGLALGAAESVGSDARLASGALVRLALPGLAAVAWLAADHVRARRSRA